MSFASCILKLHCLVQTHEGLLYIFDEVITLLLRNVPLYPFLKFWSHSNINITTPGVFKGTFLLIYVSHSIQFTCLICTSQWYVCMFACICLFSLFIYLCIFECSLAKWTLQWAVDFVLMGPCLRGLSAWTPTVWGGRSYPQRSGAEGVDNRTVGKEYIICPGEPCTTKVPPGSLRNPQMLPL